jgi:hypothetical protein
VGAISAFDKQFLPAWTPASRVARLRLRLTHYEKLFFFAGMADDPSANENIIRRLIKE